MPAVTYDQRAEDLEPQLKPCPFCGGEASDCGAIKYSKSHEAWWSDGSQILFSYYVNCMSCSCDNKGMFGHQTKEKALVAWNTRTQTKVKPLEWIIGDDRDLEIGIVARSKESTARHIYLVSVNEETFCLWRDGRRINNAAKTQTEATEAAEQENTALILGALV